jgi:riboflavin biosynthesis pyrimidine reductase
MGGMRLHQWVFPLAICRGMYLAAGLVDEMKINVVPTLLGSGQRLFDGVGLDLHGL